MEIWDIIDEHGNATGRTIVRGETLKDGDYHLAVHIWIINDKNEFLIQKRAEHLELFPGIWAVTGGSAIEGEDSQTAAIREAKEELGIDINSNNMKKMTRIKKKDHFADVWLVNQNFLLEDIKIQEEEVSDVRWITMDDLKTLIENGKFHNYGNEYFKMIFGEKI